MEKENQAQSKSVHDASRALNISAEREKYLFRIMAEIVARRFFEIVPASETPPIKYGFGNRIDTLIAIRDEIQYDKDNRENEQLMTFFLAGSVMTDSRTKIVAQLMRQFSDNTENWKDLMNEK